MMPSSLANSALSTSTTGKRKEPPASSWGSQKLPGRPRPTKRVKMRRDARSIATQTSDAALSNGELDLQAFLKAREFEIKALESGMQNAKSSLTTRAFQQVPHEMRRRTASHNVKRVPKRLQKRAAREMRDDNTPTVTPNKRKPGSSRGRIRAETAKKLGLLAARKHKDASTQESGGKSVIKTRLARPKIRTNILNDPPKAKSKFRKRQIHKTWLPTHSWHAKRARMTEPKNPLWRFSIPVTSTEKSYRPTHRAGGARGAVAWDTSYMSTIRLEGTIDALEKVLRSIGVSQSGLWEDKGERWRQGKRSWTGWLSKDANGRRVSIGPATIIWASSEAETASTPNVEAKQIKSKLQRALVRIHPSAFLDSWTELLRLSKQQRPLVSVEDLRFEIGSIEITGPGSSESLLGILCPYKSSHAAEEAHGSVFRSLAGVTNPASLPANALLAFSITDPRLRYPSRTIPLPNPTDEASSFALLQTLSAWPADSAKASADLFDRDHRFKATRLPSQKAINRRKALAPPGQYPSLINTDPRIPIMLFTSRLTSNSSAQGSWTLLAPWKCILPIWYGLVHYPLSTGSNPRFGGLDELRQTHFEHGIPWYPADFPGTSAGFAWEKDEREKRKAEWDKRPRGKRVEWDSLDLGAGRKGEIGAGWSCDFEKLLDLQTSTSSSLSDGKKDTQMTTQESTQAPDISIEYPILHCTSKEFNHLLSSSDDVLPAHNEVATIRLNFLTRGVATPCARIYRLPRSSQISQATDSTSSSGLPQDLREQWLSLVPPPSSSRLNPKSKKNTKLNVSRVPLDTPLPQRVRLLARSLIETPPMPYPKPEEENGHPLVPSEEDCIGFVTTGQYNLAEGKGCAIGSILARKVIEGLRTEDGRGKDGRLCIVRNAGETIGRLARWEAV